MTTALLRTPTGPRGRPFTGVLRAIRRDSLGFLADTFRDYGDVSTYRLGPVRSHLVAHPDGLKHVLQENVKNYTKDHISYGIIRWVAGNGLLTSQGDFWLRQRRLAQPAFHRQRIAAMGEMMVARTEAMLAGWELAATTRRSLLIGEQMMQLALGIVGDALFGTNVSAQSAAVDHSFNLLGAQIIDRFRSGNLIPPVLPTRLDRAWRAAVAEIDQVVYAIIAERRQRGEDTGDLLSMLLLARDAETGDHMDDKQLRDEVLTMLVAGHETTATTLSWTWALLDANPKAVERLWAELAAVLGGRPPSIADLPQLRYTRMVIDEALRLYPPVYILSRKVVADDEICGYRIPGGSAVDISPYIVHRHPAFWDDPEHFDPERFTPERSAARHKHAYLPFSSGPRMCIGQSFALMEATLILATVAQRFRPRLPTGQMPAALPLITLRPAGGLPMLIERR